MGEKRRLEPSDAAGWALRQRREERGLSARELSLRAGLSESYVGKMETSRIDPSLRCFARVAVALDLTPQEIAAVVRLAARELLSHPAGTVSE